MHFAKLKYRLLKTMVISTQAVIQHQTNCHNPSAELKQIKFIKFAQGYWLSKNISAMPSWFGLPV